MLWTLAQAAKQAEAGQGQGRPDGAGTHRGRAALAAVIAEAVTREDQCEPAAWRGGWGFVRCAGRHLLLPRGGQTGAAQPRGAAGTPASPSSSPLSLHCPPIRLHSPGPHTHWPPGHVLNVASGSVEPGASLVGRDLPPGPQVQNKSYRAFLQRLRREPCFSAPGASGPGVPTGQAQQFRPSAPPPSWWAQGSPPRCRTVSELGPQACPRGGSRHFPSQSNLTSAWSGDTRKTPSPESSALRLLGPPSQRPLAVPRGWGPASPRTHTESQACAACSVPLSGLCDPGRIAAVELLGLDTRWSSDALVWVTGPVR